MPDSYSNFFELAAKEPPEAYAVKLRDTGSPVVIAAPHAGGIELGTSEICLAIASGDLSYYLFEGIKAQNNDVLHITSSNFDEPRCLELLQASEVVVTVHGEGSDSDVVYLGGLHKSAMASLQTALTIRGFTVKQHTNPSLQGHHKRNICNVGRSGAGVQLELSKGLRRTFFASMSHKGRQQPTSRLDEFCSGVRDGLKANKL